MSKQLQIAIISALIIFTIGWRLSPHLANFAPVAALALLSGMVLRNKLALLPLAITMGVTDVIIGGYQGMEYTWLAFASVVLLGMAVRKWKDSAWLVPVGALGSSLLFFIISNFGVWVASGMYSHTLAGLIQCYVMGLPFFGATLLSDILFISVFTTVWALAPVVAKNIKQQPTYLLGSTK